MTLASFFGLIAAERCAADTTMASYADNRNALFGTSKDAKPKPKPQKKSYTLGGQSKAAQQRQRERQRVAAPLRCTHTLHRGCARLPHDIAVPAIYMFGGRPKRLGPDRVHRLRYSDELLLLTKRSLWCRTSPKPSFWGILGCEKYFRMSRTISRSGLIIKPILKTCSGT